MEQKLRTELKVEMEARQQAVERELMERMQRQINDRVDQELQKAQLKGSLEREQQQLQQAQQRQQTQQEQASRGPVTVTPAPSKAKGQANRQGCFGCGATTHRVRDCPHAQPRQQKGSGGKGSQWSATSSATEYNYPPWRHSDQPPRAEEYEPPPPYEYMMQRTAVPTAPIPQVPLEVRPATPPAIQPAPPPLSLQLSANWGEDPAQMLQHELLQLLQQMVQPRPEQTFRLGAWG